MIFKKTNRLKGFTLVEVMVAVAIFSVLMFVVTGLLLSIIQNPKLQLSAMSNIDQARSVASKFTNEIRAAAYGTYPLTEANDSEITFFSPIGAATGNINRIRYYTQNNVLYKGVIVPINGAYNPASEVLTPVLIVQNASVPLFYYYNGDYNASGTGTALLNPVNVNDVKFVEINLIVQNPENTGNSTFNLKSGAAIRILKNNLRN